MSITRTAQKTLRGSVANSPARSTTRNIYSHERGEVSSHNWYTSVAGFSGEFVLKILREQGIERGKLVFDPFLGTGTSALTSMTAGMVASGIEANPFHYLVAKTKFNFQINQSEIGLALHRLRQGLNEAEGSFRFERALTIPIKEHLSKIKEANGGPPEMPHLLKWMSPRVLEHVMKVKSAINDLSVGKDVVDFVRVAFGSILIPVSNMQMAGPKIAYRRKKGRRIVCLDAPVVSLFLQKLESMISDVKAYSDTRGWTAPNVFLGDSRHVDTSFKQEADIAVTSPPYLNEVDYVENTRLELFFLDFVKDESQMRKLKERLIRANSKYLFKSNRDYPDNLPDYSSFNEILDYSRRIEKVWVDRDWGWDHPRLVAEYFCDMTHHLEGMLKILKPRAPYVILVGDSAIDGILVPTDKILAQLARDVGFESAEVQPFRYRSSSRHRTRLRESIVTLAA